MFKMFMGALVAVGLGFSGLSVQAETGPVQVAQNPVNWQGYDAGLASAKGSNKFVIVQFFADWCGYCRKMDKEVFTQTEIQKSLKQWFVPVRVKEKSTTQATYQGKRMAERDLMTAYQVTGFPTLVFLEPDGKQLVAFPGYMEPQELDGMLKFIGSKAYKKMDYQAFEKKFLKNGKFQYKGT